MTDKTPNYGNRPPEDEGILTRFFASLSRAAAKNRAATTSTVSLSRAMFLTVLPLIVAGVSVVFWVAFSPLMTLHAALLSLASSIIGGLAVTVVARRWAVAQVPPFPAWELRTGFRWLTSVFVSAAFTSCTLFWGANRLLDTTPGLVLTMPVTGNTLDLDTRHGRTPSPTRYFLTYELVFPDDLDMHFYEKWQGHNERIAVPLEIFNAYEPGRWAVSLRLHQGAFLMPWYGSAMLVPAQEDMKRW